MPEDSEGLELDEVLEDVDDVSTGAVEAILEVVIDTGPNEEDVMDIRTVKGSKEQIKQNCHYDEMQVMNELVTREDHEEALREAVQIARKRERRRILDKMDDFASKHWGGQFKAYGEDWKNAWKELYEELEEEVSEDV